jgi:hypothetical protein
MGIENRVEGSGMTTTIGKSDVWALIDRLIEARGKDFTYEQIEDHLPYASSCVYTYDGAPSCAVGWVVYEMAPLPETITFMERLDADHAGDSSFGELVVHFEDYLSAEFTEAAREMLIEFQYQQDNGINYGQIAEYIEMRWPREGA